MTLEYFGNWQPCPSPLPLLGCFRQHLIASTPDNGHGDHEWIRALYGNDHQIIKHGQCSLACQLVQIQWTSMLFLERAPLRILVQVGNFSSLNKAVVWLAGLVTVLICVRIADCLSWGLLWCLFEVWFAMSHLNQHIWLDSWAANLWSWDL